MKVLGDAEEVHFSSYKKLASQLDGDYQGKFGEREREEVSCGDVSASKKRRLGENDCEQGKFSLWIFRCL